ncbi:hypothetical protein [Sphingomonas sp. PB4P5]|uniref:hypothetical protein n=1 Tax=Parasphingomonas puruogangriensis TaxID=3096155 RepID=UPI002FC77824
MPWRTLVELLHLAVGILATLLLSSLAAWSVPNARDSITIVAWAAAGVIVVMTIRPLRRAWARDRGRAPISGESLPGE